MNPIDRLKAAGMSLPAVEDPAFNYLAFVEHQGVVWLAGQLAKVGGVVKHQGQVPQVVSPEEAARQMGQCGLQAISRLNNALGDLSRVERVLHMNAYVACAADFDGISAIADHASRVFIEAFGEAGRHPRSVLGVNRLPQNAPVMIDLRVAVFEAG
ncbi:MAG: RidA family protein [Burkholderiaceae bacterium]